MNLLLRGPFDGPTHKSGSTIEFVFSSYSLAPVVQRVDRSSLGLRSDHDAILVSNLGCVCVSQQTLVGRSRWCPHVEDWDGALSMVSSSLAFINDWIAAILEDTFIRDSVASGSQHALRQALIDRVTWWRAALMVMAGHMSGLAVTSRAVGSGAGSDERQQVEQFLLNWFAEHPCEEPSDWQELSDCILGADKRSKVLRLLNLQQENPAKAQAFLSRLLKPKLPLQLAIRDDGTGNVLSDAEVLKTLDSNIRARPLEAETGDEDFTAAVTEQVRLCRRAAQEEVSCEPHLMISQEELDGHINSVLQAKASLRFPRAVLHCNAAPVRRLHCLMLNLFFALGLVPSCWLREISPVRKRGPDVVSDLNNLRPISYTDDLETLFDLVWLSRQRRALESYAGTEQGGGCIDSSLIALGVVLALQARSAWRLPSFLLKTDLLQGYDLAWKNAVLLQAKWAGVTGSFWLCLDASFSHDQCRIRLGPLLGSTLVLLDAGLGQGGRRAVHLFNTLTRGLAEEVLARCAGAAVGANPLMVRPFLAATEFESMHAAGRPPLVDRISRMALSTVGAFLEVDFASAISPRTNRVEALLTIDAASPCTLALVQFVDDVFCLQSTCWGLKRACQGLQSFAHLWRHKFASGRKAASYMTIGAVVPDNSSLAPVGGSLPRAVDCLGVLGVLVDADLSFLPLLEKTIAVLGTETMSLIKAMRDLTLSIPLQIRELQSRAEAKALYGAEALASAACGWPEVVRRINVAHYNSLKAVLGAERCSLGAGAQHQTFAHFGG